MTLLTQKLRSTFTFEVITDKHKHVVPALQ